jgi:hypothetical protein
MKKLAILSAMMFAVALWFGCTVNAGCTPPPPEDCGDGGSVAARDVKSVTVSSDGTTITVVVVLCDGVNRHTKYRLHIDHKHWDFPNTTGPDTLDPNPAGKNYPCETSSDDTIKLHNRKTTGAEGSTDGLVDITTTTITDDTLTFEVDYIDLVDDNGDPVLSTDTVYLWVDTQYKGIRDRVPDTDVDGEDGCSKPKNICEVIELILN